MKVVLLPDTHVPFNILLDPVWEFIEDFKPDQVVLMGDMSDWTSVSHWIADQSRALDGGTIAENYEQLHTVVLDPLQKAAGKKCKKIFLEGNHERWLALAASLNPNGRGYWELEKNIDLKKYNMVLVQENVPFKISEHLYAIHGVYTNEFHAKKTVQAYHKSILFAHVHAVQEYTLVSPIDAKVVMKGKSIGCLCTRNPAYMRNKPNAWVNGFNFTYVNEDGTFNEFQVNIIEGKFWANGRRYS